MMQYFVLPNCWVARNLRVASMAIAQASLQTFYPAFANNCVLPVDYWRTMPLTTTPGSPTYILIRDPIARFLSALNVYEMDVGTGISRLPDLYQTDEHFMPQSGYNYTTAFQYETQLPQFCAATGLPSLPLVNQSDVTQTLTPEQTAYVQQVYAGDIALHASLGSS